MTDYKNYTKDQWREKLTTDQYRVAREHGTEPPFSGVYHDSKQQGIYRCICCDANLFRSDDKFDSGTGWPSYIRPFSPEAVTNKSDSSHGMVRVEVLCSNCDAHLGHVFPDGPKPTGLRYCINSVCLKLTGEQS